MSEIKKIVADIESVFAENTYPSEFLAEYDQMECLANHTGRETFLVRRKSDGMPAIAKCYDRKTFPLKPDLSLLQDISSDGLPKYYGQYSNDRILCIIREYIDGTPLNLYVKERTLKRDEILSIAEQLCDILNTLHSRKPPVIHRDIKPDNIIIRPDGRICLIDFEIARTINPSSENDSIIFGTRGYAPPEQYGFEQTDQKADIYAFGVLLRWLMTGSIRPNPNIRIDPAIQRTIDRCTAFAPEERFADIMEVKRSLSVSGKSRIQISKRMLMCLLIGAVLLLGLGFAAGRFSGFPKQQSEAEPPVTFTEPIIEEAVRLQLGVDKNAVLTAEDLSHVRRLFIYGRHAYADPETFYQQDISFHWRGTIHSLNDLEMLPDLEMFCMVYQEQVDISALARMQKLTYIELKHTKLENIYPLSELPMLRQAILFDTGLSDVTALEACHWLDTLEVGYNPITSMAQIGSHPYLLSLSLRGLKMETLDGIEEMPGLQGLTLVQAEIGDLSAITKLPKLEQVYTNTEMAAALAEVLSGTNIGIIETE